ncbi:MAG: Segregation and condensation protein [Oscillospiraceae bacterium]|nr:Segregation and condensation protein [Oscillospiraceae bacterium]
MDRPVFHLEGVVKNNSAESGQGDFNGPLDLILHLLSKNKMEIKDISISLILAQYMDWMDKRGSMNLEVASEFVSMAAHLVYIKTRMLLSIHDEEALSEMEQLIATLEEHQRNENYIKVKSVLPVLERRFEIGRDYITKPPELISAEKSYRYMHAPDDLRKSLFSLLERSEVKLLPPTQVFQRIVGKEQYPVSSKVDELINRMKQWGMTRFRRLFFGSGSRSEIIATFLAVLELCKARRIWLAGDESECTVSLTGEGEEIHFSAE